jgi:hypothetical protein
MHEGFTVDLDEAAKAADKSLPSAIEHLRRPIATLVAHEGFAGPGSFDAAGRFESAYQGWGEAQARRLRFACDILDANVAALREIIALYRRVDGRI